MLATKGANAATAPAFVHAVILDFNVKRVHARAHLASTAPRVTPAPARVRAPAATGFVPQLAHAANETDEN